jgi:hypothetical protein
MDDTYSKTEAGNERLISVCVPVQMGIVPSRSIEQVIEGNNFSPQQLITIVESIKDGALFNLDVYGSAGLEQACKYLAVAERIDRQLGYSGIYT